MFVLLTLLSYQLYLLQFFMGAVVRIRNLVLFRIVGKYSVPSYVTSISLTKQKLGNTFSVWQNNLRKNYIPE